MGTPLDGDTLLAGISKKVSRLALGTAFYRLDSRTQWFEVLDRFVALGGTLIDSARIYGDSEAVLGEWMAARGVREQVVLATKCGSSGNRPDGLMPPENFSRMVTEELQTSLRHLRTDHIDLYVLHRDNPAIPVAEILGRLNEEIRRGTVRALAASNWSCARLEEANAWARQNGLTGFAAASNNLSLARPTGPFYAGLVSVDAAGERWHVATRLPLIVWSSQARGFFTGRYTPARRDRLAEVTDGFERKMFEVYGTDENFERLRRAQELGRRRGGSSAVEVALAWLLHKPFPLVPIVGPHTVAELESCVAALSLRLTEAECGWLDLGGE